MGNVYKNTSYSVVEFNLYNYYNRKLIYDCHSPGTICNLVTNLFQLPIKNFINACTNYMNTQGAYFDYKNAYIRVCNMEVFIHKPYSEDHKHWYLHISKDKELSLLAKQFKELKSNIDRMFEILEKCYYKRDSQFYRGTFLGHSYTFDLNLLPEGIYKMLEDPFYVSREYVEKDCIHSLWGSLVFVSREHPDTIEYSKVRINNLVKYLNTNRLLCEA